MPNEFRITIKTDNAAFTDEEGEAGAREQEVARILRDVAHQLEDGIASAGSVRDYNGNTVGDFGFRIEGVMP
jgi:hypothetical protein